MREPAAPPGLTHCWRPHAKTIIPRRNRFAADPPAPEPTEPLARMLYRLKTQAGRALYRLRKQTIEPVFGIVKNVLGWRQLSLRGLDAAAGEWSLVTMAWNVKRMYVLRHG